MPLHRYFDHVQGVNAFQRISESLRTSVGTISLEEMTAGLLYIKGINIEVLAIRYLDYLVAQKAAAKKKASASGSGGPRKKARRAEAPAPAGSGKEVKLQMEQQPFVRFCIHLFIYNHYFSAILEECQERADKAASHELSEVFTAGAEKWEERIQEWGCVGDDVENMTLDFFAAMALEDATPASVMEAFDEHIAEDYFI